MTESEDFWQQAYEQAKADMPEEVPITPALAWALWQWFAEDEDEAQDT